MSVTDLAIIAAMGAIGYGAVSFFLGRRRTPPPASEPGATPAADAPPAPPSADSTPSGFSQQSAWDQLHDRPTSEAPPKR